MTARQPGRRPELVRPPRPPLDGRTLTAPAVLVLVADIPAIAVEARVGVLPAVACTCLGTVPVPGRSQPAVEIRFDARRLGPDELIAEAGGGAQAASREGFIAAPADEQKPHLARESVFHSHYAAIYPDPAARSASTAMARVNGYLAGYGRVDQLMAEMAELGLPMPLEKALRVRVFPGAAGFDDLA